MGFQLCVEDGVLNLGEHELQGHRLVQGNISHVHTVSSDPHVVQVLVDSGHGHEDGHNQGENGDGVAHPGSQQSVVHRLQNDVRNGLQTELAQQSIVKILRINGTRLVTPVSVAGPDVEPVVPHVAHGNGLRHLQKHSYAEPKDQKRWQRDERQSLQGHSNNPGEHFQHHHIQVIMVLEGDQQRETTAEESGVRDVVALSRKIGGIGSALSSSGGAK
mmetsp:Transcript_29606/g.50783  ORF Transcript_29606/g.50783 Transcript_29606/m.50783 type:complete len:217 (+) Transcript_29606:791-1441(+)